ncbi:MAG TPA: OB-fold nucleic acid binding domain-containing protein, partial [Candidatus Caenarcaniphilales bacterium]|nr:OB-fold nucleic acid binding domain-containing protein [Candidatus Caenarcaniphilales bacterium]
AQKDKFVRQAAERGVPAQTIDAVFKAFEPFERYGFNKAHATCYGLIAYQTAYLKANYTVEYMASVLTAFRDNTEKVGAAIAECRRLGIQVLPPDVHASGLHFTVEGDAIRFGLLAVKNVGQGAIESIVSTRREGGRFRSLADFCARVDLRLANRRVLESLVKVGALSSLGHPAQLLVALDDALAAGQAAQRDRLTGQVSLFDSTIDAAPLERPLPTGIPEAVPRERLRWEKELLGLYLSDHPLGEHATEIGRFVTAYSGDLGEELDQQRVVVCGVVTEVRRVITKARATMGVAILEDLQGTIEVIVFPKVYEQTAPTWAEDAILLVSGRVDHKGEETVLLADAVWSWDEARAVGPDTFAQQVVRLDRGRRNGNGNGYGNGGHREPAAFAAPPPPTAEQVAVPRVVPIGPGRESEAATVLTVPRVSPLRGVVLEGTIDVVIGSRPRPSPMPAAVAEPESVALLGADASEEPPLPDELGRQIAAHNEAPTTPVQATAGQSLHIRFLPAAQEQVVRGFETLREIIHEHPGETPIVLRIPAGPGREQRMELRRGVAYDAELLASIRRRVGESLVEVTLVAPPARG